jgi:hypothetical protein
MVVWLNKTLFITYNLVYPYGWLKRIKGYGESRFMEIAYQDTLKWIIYINMVG